MSDSLRFPSGSPSDALSVSFASHRVGNRPLNGAEAAVCMLEAHGVQHVFGLCGDTSLPFYDALARSQGRIIHVLSRDERCAGYMADAYARLTGRVGVCEGPSGGGATYILPGVVEANESSIALLALTTDIAVSSRGRFALTELDQASLFRPLTKWNGVIDHASRLPSMFRTAFRQASTGRPGAVHLGLPYDIQQAEIDSEQIWAQPECGLFPAWRSAPDSASIDRLAAAICKARFPIFVCGGGVLISGAERALAQIAETYNLAVATSISGQGSLSGRHPQNIGVVGTNGGVAQSQRLLAEADLVIFVGCRAGSVTTERWTNPASGTLIAHIDSDPLAISANYYTELPVISDARLALEALAEALSGANYDGGADEKIAAMRQARRAQFDRHAKDSEPPIKPERLIAELARALPENAIITADPGTPCPYLSAWFDQPAGGRRIITNRAHGALGYALGAAIGAQFACPEARIVSVMGDGSFGFTCGELETIKRLELPIILIVIANDSFGWIRAGQRHGFEERFFSVDFSPGDHAAIARAFGINSETISEPAELAPALRRAVDKKEAILLDVKCQKLDEASAPVSEWVA